MAKTVFSFPKPGRPSPERIVLGEKELDARLRNLSTKVANRVARLALASGARVVRKGVVAGIPSRYKGARSSIGWRVGSGRGRGRASGVTQAKIGAAVKKKDARIPRSERPRRRGVGIGAKNIHWFILGATGAKPTIGKKGPPRLTTKGASRGIMPPQFPGVVQQGLASTRSATLAKMIKTVIDGIKREWAKGNR